MQVLYQLLSAIEFSISSLLMTVYSRLLLQLLTTLIASLLNTFSLASGQKINFPKSIILFSTNVPNRIKNTISHILNIPHKTSIGRYLGVNNIIRWKDSLNYKDIILKAQKKLAGWKANSLSIGGRLTLIKANLSGMPNHLLSCFKGPSKLSKSF